VQVNKIVKDSWKSIWVISDSDCELLSILKVFFWPLKIPMHFKNGKMEKKNA